MTAPTFPEFWLGLAAYVATKSKDPSSKVGAVVVDPETEDVLSLGWNDHPRRVHDKPERRERPLKYLYTEHAERNAVYNAAASGRSLRGATMYTTHYPCADCARAIIQSGIKKVVTGGLRTAMHGAPQEPNKIAAGEMLAEAGIELVEQGEE